MQSPLWFWGSPTLPMLGAFLPLVILLSVWSLVIKGFALWHAARLNQRSWFIAMLVINTMGILELIYLIWFRADKKPAHHSSHVQA